MFGRRTIQLPNDITVVENVINAFTAQRSLAQPGRNGGANESACDELCTRLKAFGFVAYGSGRDRAVFLRDAADYVVKVPLGKRRRHVNALEYNFPNSREDYIHYFPASRLLSSGLLVQEHAAPDELKYQQHCDLILSVAGRIRIAEPDSTNIGWSNGQFLFIDPTNGFDNDRIARGEID